MGEGHPPSSRHRRASSGASISTLFLDIGGVLLTDGWAHLARQRAVKHFDLEPAELEKRHRIVFEAFEAGKLTLDEYLKLVVFHQKRSFTRAAFREFMFAQSGSYPPMLQLMARLKRQYGLKVVVVSNEARELNAHRIHHFQLRTLVDTFVSSCFVHLRKPDADIFRLALDVAQVEPAHVLYLDNTAMFVEIAAGLGIQGIHHRSYLSTRSALQTAGLGVA